MLVCDCCRHIQPCPNCRKKTNHCIDCGKPIYKTSLRCSHCNSIIQYQKYLRPAEPKIDWPGVDELEERISVAGLNETARRLGISRQGLTKHFKLAKAKQLETWLETKSS